MLNKVSRRKFSYKYRGAVDLSGNFSQSLFTAVVICRRGVTTRYM
jgi:hypothetical protein